MYGVELYAAVRLAVVEEGLSHREAGRRFGIDRRTAKKMLSYSAPPGLATPHLYIWISDQVCSFQSLISECRPFQAYVGLPDFLGSR